VIGLGKVFIPTLSQHVYVGVLHAGHCTNLAEDGYQNHLRSLLKGEQSPLGVTRHWAMEGQRDVLVVKNANRADDIVSLRHVTGTDNMDFTRDG
jgi:hypothetical protein